MEVQVDISGQSLWVPVDTAALSIWVDHDWFLGKGGTVRTSLEVAEAVDGHKLEVEGVGSLKFELWGRNFFEEVRVMRNLPDKILIGRRF